MTRSLRPRTPPQRAQLARQVVLGAALVPVVREHLDLGRSRVAVVGGEHRGGRADPVHQPHREPCGRARARGEVDPVEVGQGLHRLLDPEAVPREPAGYLRVRSGVRDLRGPPVVAEERHVGDGRRHVVPQSGDGQRESAALAAAEDGDPFGVHRVVGLRRVDGPDRVGDEPPVVVPVGVLDAAGQETGRGRTVALGPDVRGVGGVLAAAALPPVVHHQVRVAERAPGQPCVRDAPPAVVPDVLHHGRQRPGALLRQHQPRLHRLPVPAPERHIEYVDGRQSRLVRHEPGVDVVPGRLREGLLPEGVEVGRFLRLGAVLPQPLQIHVEQQGSSSSSG